MHSPGVDTQSAWIHCLCRPRCPNIWAYHLVQILPDSKQWLLETNKPSINPMKFMHCLIPDPHPISSATRNKSRVSSSYMVHHLDQTVVVTTLPTGIHQANINWTHLRCYLILAYLQKEDRAGYRQLQHLQHPRSHRKLCPNGCWNKSQLVPQQSFVHHAIWHHRLDKLLEIHQSSVTIKINKPRCSWDQTVTYIQFDTWYQHLQDGYSCAHQSQCFCSHTV